MADIPEMDDVRVDLSEAGRLRRIERERAMIAEAEAQFLRGEYHEFEVVEAWLDALETDPDAKLPPFPRRG